MSNYSSFQEVVRCDADFSDTPLEGWGIIISTPEKTSMFMNAESLAKQFASTNNVPSSDHTMLNNAIHAVKDASIAQASNDGTNDKDLCHLKAQWKIMIHNLGNGIVSFDNQATTPANTEMPVFLRR